ncbi:hypothetical protein SAMN05660420_01702 [Desulfuromusa kysingii]|uniref:Uncharacterized protein n=1 Tax=Desulfuromusa kysingii TaxID=37625 RepID=A0A1H3ZWA8_9BACT|nr:hypothetical protein [Desulfuromusa kysingii]SEA27928.1 hypothetical protein SAMN05660420_01702 [Desulfuromusa kysingii]
MMTILFKNELERKQHEEAIRQLCEEHPEKQQYIKTSYLQALKPMISDAQIRTYLSIFASRKVKILLQSASPAP